MIHILALLPLFVCYTMLSFDFPIRLVVVGLVVQTTVTFTKSSLHKKCQVWGKSAKIWIIFWQPLALLPLFVCYTMLSFDFPIRLVVVGLVVQTTVTFTKSSLHKKCQAWGESAKIWVIFWQCHFLKIELVIV